MTDDASEDIGMPQEIEMIDLTHLTAPRPVHGVNGNGNGVGRHVDTAPRPDASTDSASDLDALEWNTSYDRAAVERHLLQLDEEQARLEAEIADSERRTAAAEEALAARAAALEADLGAVVVAARAELARIEAEQADAVDAIRAEADAEVARIRQTARIEADALRGAAASLATAMPVPGGPTAGSDRELSSQHEDQTDAG